VREYGRCGRGLRVGFVLADGLASSDGARCANDEEARKLCGITHGLIREILTNYGKIDTLCGMTSPGLGSRLGVERMNKMVFLSYCEQPQ
jgi:alpha-L-fucosidase